MCKICMDKKHLVFIYDVSSAAHCQDCLKLGHKKCVRQRHDCRLTPAAQYK